MIRDFTGGVLPSWIFRAGKRIASDAQLGMLQVEISGLLIGAREGEEATFAVELTKESEADGGAGAAIAAFDFAFVILARGRSIVAAKTIRQNQRRMVFAATMLKIGRAHV